MTIDELIAKIATYKIPHSTEEEMQFSISLILTANQILFTREAVLNKKDRVDFLTDCGIAIECKVKGQPLAIHRQIERYAQSDMVKAIVLFTSKFMQVKPEINGKPTKIIYAGKAWL